METTADVYKREQAMRNEVEERVLEQEFRKKFGHENPHPLAHKLIREYPRSVYRAWRSKYLPNGKLKKP